MDEQIDRDNEERKSSNPYDAMFKEVMAERFTKLRIPIQTEQKVSRKPRTIDVVITCNEDIATAKRETTFDFLFQNNIIALGENRPRETSLGKNYTGHYCPYSGETDTQ